jgi:hypothetical protein
MTEAPTRHGDPRTSFAAADAITPHVPTIREEVLAWAETKPEGFIDEELSDHFGAEGSSYRTRRAELTDEQWIIDTGKERENSHGRLCVIWKHRSHIVCPPPLKPRVQQSSTTLHKEALAMADRLGGFATQMRSEGRVPFANQLQEAQRIIRELLK